MTKAQKELITEVRLVGAWLQAIASFYYCKLSAQERIDAAKQLNAWTEIVQKAKKDS